MVVAVETAADPLLVGQELLLLQGHAPGQVWNLARIRESVKKAASRDYIAVYVCNDVELRDLKCVSHLEAQFLHVFCFGNDLSQLWGKVHYKFAVGQHCVRERVCINHLSRQAKIIG